jgi:HK97 family phage prohead protease
MAKDENEFILSDGSQINTKGFRVDLSGGRFTRFDNNPVMLYDHDTAQVIGRWENRRIENGKLFSKPVFDMGDPVAAEKARKVKDGFLKGASIGFIPYKMEEIGDEYVLTDWELIEASITPLPSDAGAVRLYNEKLEVVSFEQVKLNLIHQLNRKTMDKDTTIVLTAVTRQSLGLSSDYTAREIELAVAEKDKSIADMKTEIKGLKMKGIDTYLSQAVKDGKIDEKQKAEYLKLSETNFDSVKAIIDAKPAQASASLKDMTQKSNLTAGERASWTYLDWTKKDSKGLLKLKQENPTEFERLQTEFINSKN